MTFEVTKKSVEDLFEKTDGLYIPAIQRSFSWSKANVERFFEDITELFGRYRCSLQLSGNMHADENMFIGSILTVHDKGYEDVIPAFRPELPDKVWTVIDGQQRITTLTICNVILHIKLAEYLKKINKIKADNLGEQIVAGKNYFTRILDRSLNELWKMIVIDRTSGEGACRYYPKVIKSIHDAWSTINVQKNYSSPLASYLWAYIKYNHDNIASKFDYSSCDRNVITAHEIISKSVSAFIKKHKLVEPNVLISWYEGLGAELHEDIKNILNCDCDGTKLLSIKKNIVDAMCVLTYTKLIHKRVECVFAYTERSDEAFAIFDALNTTGVPLNPVETFKPIVIKDVGIENYEMSEHKEHFENIEKYLMPNDNDKIKPEDKNKRCLELITHFGLSECGTKLPLKLVSQRKFLMQRYNAFDADDVGCSTELGSKIDFTRRLSYLSSFLRNIWEANKNSLFYHRDLSSEEKVCLRFLNDLSHTIAIAPLFRFYIKCQRLENCSRQSEHQIAVNDFKEALRVTTAFSVIWLTAWGGTNNIDNHYRSITSELLTFDKDSSPNSLTLYRERLGDILLHEIRSTDVPTLDCENEIERLKRHWISLSSKHPTYSAGVLAKMLLHLIADRAVSVSDPKKCFLELGVPAAGAKMSVERWYGKDDIEHIAPRPKPKGGARWQEAKYDTIYDPPDHHVNLLGNLLIIPSAINRGSHLVSSSWQQKRKIYRLLGSSTAEQISNTEYCKQMTESSLQLFIDSGHNVLCNAVSQHSADWLLHDIKKRTDRMLELAWSRIVSWIFPK